jgi:hypothetical protein
MGRILASLGILLGIVVARTLDAAWVMWWYAGDRALDFPIQAALDAVGLAVGGFVAGRFGLWLAGSSARGIGLWIAIGLLVTTAVDLVVGLANEPWWHEVLTALVMVPAAAWGGGARLPRRHKRVKPVTASAGPSSP